MEKINIIGIGPGNPSYILPAAIDAFKESDVIIGGKRNLESIDLEEKELIVITDNLKEIIEYINQNYKTKKISIAATGDAGFYGILGYLKKHFTSDMLNVIPGISSFQYMFSKLGLTWENVYLGSLHGKNEDLLEKMKKYNRAVFLTDKDNSYKYIAKILSANGHKDKIMYVGANLSYDNEVLIKDRVENFVNKEDDYKLCVVVIWDE